MAWGLWHQGVMSWTARLGNDGFVVTGGNTEDTGWDDVFLVFFKGKASGRNSHIQQKVLTEQVDVIDVISK